MYSLTRWRVQLSHSTALTSNIHAYDTRHTRDLPSWHAIDAGNIVPCEPVRRWRRANKCSMQRRSASNTRLVNKQSTLFSRLMLATHAQETSTRNLYKKLARVSVNLVKVFLVQDSCMQLSTATSGQTVWSFIPCFELEYLILTNNLTHSWQLTMTSVRQHWPMCWPIWPGSWKGLKVYLYTVSKKGSNQTFGNNFVIS